MTTRILLWIPLAIVIVTLCALVYVVVQQSYRQSANDPQIQIANDVANNLSRGQPPQEVVPPNATVDISKSLASFIIIYDDNEKVIASGAQLDGKTPTLPNGVLKFAKDNGEHRLTWQSSPDVRHAAVIVHYSGSNSGYVLAGRSLREVEKRVAEMNRFVLLTLAGSLLLTLGFYLVMPMSKNSKRT